MTNTENITDEEMQGVIFTTAEEGAREFAGQSGSGNAHIDIRALAGIQGSSRFLHSAFRQPLTVDSALHFATDSEGHEAPETETKRFIH
jgi:hypothetical protein